MTSFVVLFVQLADRTFIIQQRSFYFFLIGLASTEPRDYRVVFGIQKDAADQRVLRHFVFCCIGAHYALGTAALLESFLRITSTTTVPRMGKRAAISMAALNPTSSGVMPAVAIRLAA